MDKRGSEAASTHVFTCFLPTASRQARQVRQSVRDRNDKHRKEQLPQDTVVLNALSLTGHGYMVYSTSSLPIRAVDDVVTAQCGPNPTPHIDFLRFLALVLLQPLRPLAQQQGQPFGFPTLAFVADVAIHAEP